MKHIMDEETKKGYRDAFINNQEVHDIAMSMIHARTNGESRRTSRKLISDGMRNAYNEYNATYEPDRLAEVYIWQLMSEALSKALSYGSTFEEVVELVTDVYMAKFLSFTNKCKGNYEKAFMILTESTYDNNPIMIEIA